MDGRAVLLGLAFALMWSSAFTSARIIVAYAPPLYSLSARFLISGLIGVIIALMLGQSWRLSRKQWISVAVFGVCQNALYLGLNFVAMQTVEASLAAIIASTMPLIVACAGWIIFRERLSTLGICGLIAGLIGVALIMGSRIRADVDLFGIALCVVGAASLAAATLSMRGVSSSGNFLMIVGLQMLVGSLTLWVPAMMLETPTIVWTNSFVYAFIYTTLVPGLLATLVWFILVDRIGAVRASTYHFLNPFFGVAIAAAILHEGLSSLDILGVAIVAGGILAVQLAKRS
ncbi:MAG: DMT family transporter [Rhodobacteraceae bacterium]|nr:DMT family transporter [Paracoccaceae bacterium]